MSLFWTLVDAFGCTKKKYLAKTNILLQVHWRMWMLGACSQTSQQWLAPFICHPLELRLSFTRFPFTHNLVLVKISILAHLGLIKKKKIDFFLSPKNYLDVIWPLPSPNWRVSWVSFMVKKKNYLRLILLLFLNYIAHFTFFDALRVTYFKKKIKILKHKYKG